MNQRAIKPMTPLQIESRLQELDQLHEFTPAQQREFDSLEEQLSEWKGNNL